jgi:phage protein D
MAADTITMTQESLELGNFYVPQFEVRIQGAGLPRDVLRDVREVTYTDDIDEIDGFQITVNNWDPDKRDYKYIGSETPDSLSGNAGSSDESARQRLFDPCNKEVELWMGYADKMQLMMKGIFTTLTPNFPSSGGPTLTVGALNLLYRFKGEKHTKVWEQKKPSEIAAEFKLTNPATHAELQVVVDSNSQSAEPQLPYVLQDAQYDLTFLMSLARKTGYVLLLQEEIRDESENVTRPAQIYFGPSNGSGLRRATVELGYGKSLMEFKPTLTTANQIKSVTVNGWNRDTKSAISQTANITDSGIDFNQDLKDLLNVCDPHEEQVVNEPVFTDGQALARARYILANRFRDMVTASATTVGVPDIRAGRNVVITGIGSRFSGNYFVTQSTHSIGTNGYTTAFNARREDQSQKGQGQ